MVLSIAITLCQLQNDQHVQEALEHEVLADEKHIASEEGLFFFFVFAT